MGTEKPKSILTLRPLLSLVDLALPTVCLASDNYSEHGSLETEITLCKNTWVQLAAVGFIVSISGYFAQHPNTQIRGH